MNVMNSYVYKCHKGKAVNYKRQEDEYDITVKLCDAFVYPTSGVPELVEAGLIYPITVNQDEIKSVEKMMKKDLGNDIKNFSCRL